MKESFARKKTTERVQKIQFVATKTYFVLS